MARVDYEQVASTYQSGRSAVAHEDAWQPLITPYLPDRSPLHVLDLGAGTGIFARVWPDWGATHVVALDPSPGMLAEARRIGLPGAWPVNGRGEWLPLRDDSVDAAWISTVFHHLAEPDRCVGDLARVLRGPGSVVLVRAMYPERWSGGWHHLLPGIERALTRFPRLDELTALFASGGFELRGVEAVPEPPTTGAEVADWIRRMRHADTLLGALTDDEIAAGLATLDAIGDGEQAGPTLETAVFGL
jgi:ubiquinone/menaquinone biosynthesis C-methylase UbiE